MGQSGCAQRRQWLGRPAPAYVAAGIWPTRNVGAGRTGDRWLWTAPRRKRSPPAAPTLHLLHCVYPSWRLPASPGLPPGLRRAPTVQFWLRTSTSPTRSVCPSRGSPTTGHSRGRTSGLPTTSISGCPRHEQTTDRPARLPVQPVWLRTGLGQLRTGLLRPQPAASLLRGPLSAWLGGSPRWRKWLWTRSEPQRTRIPSLSTLAAAPPCGWQAAETRIQTCELVTITNLVEIPTRPWGEGGRLLAVAVGTWTEVFKYISFSNPSAQ